MRRFEDLTLFVMLLGGALLALHAGGASLVLTMLALKHDMTAINLEAPRLAGQSILRNGAGFAAAVRIVAGDAVDVPGVSGLGHDHFVDIDKMVPVSTGLG
ncbi:MAG: hypothetical protein HY646_02100 [Acidobacteria bacterium]|nr:hypothetical protein [Acidobacteriota bacterium]